MQTQPPLPHKQHEMACTNIHRQGSIAFFHFNILSNRVGHKYRRRTWRRYTGRAPICMHPRPAASGEQERQTLSIHPTAAAEDTDAYTIWQNPAVVRHIYLTGAQTRRLAGEGTTGRAPGLVPSYPILLPRSEIWMPGGNPQTDTDPTRSPVHAVGLSCLLRRLP